MGVRVVSEDFWRALMARFDAAIAALERSSALADELTALRQRIADLERLIAAQKEQ